MMSSVVVCECLCCGARRQEETDLRPFVINGGCLSAELDKLIIRCKQFAAELQIEALHG